MGNSRIFRSAVFYGLVLYWLIPGTATAYVLEGRQILYLMIKNMGTAKSLLVDQRLTQYPIDTDGEAVISDETLQYAFPDRFRADTVSDHARKIYLFNAGQSITVIDDKITTTEESSLFQYKAVLLFRDLESLTSRLAFLGLDFSTSSLGRFEDRIAYIVGAQYPDESLPQLWVDQKTFRPLRLLIPDGHDKAAPLMEFRYINWQKYGSLWYPMTIEIYTEHRWLQKIDVNSIDVNTTFDEDLFNMASFLDRYQAVTPDVPENQPADALHDVQRSVEDFQHIVP